MTHAVNTAVPAKCRVLVIFLLVYRILNASKPIQCGINARKPAPHKRLQCSAALEISQYPQGGRENLDRLVAKSTRCSAR